MGAGSQRVVQGIGIVRHEHHGGTAVFASRVVDQAQRGRLAARAQPSPTPSAPAVITITFPALKSLT